MATKLKHLREFNERHEFPYVYVSLKSSNECFCKYCDSTFSASQRELFRQHAKTSRHQKNMDLKKKRTASQALLGDILPTEKVKKTKAELLGGELCKGFLAANIPLKKMMNPILRDVLQNISGITLPRETMLRAKHLPECYSETFHWIKEDFEERAPVGYHRLHQGCLRPRGGQCTCGEIG